MHAGLEKHRGQIAALCRRYAVRRLDVFGSATTERYDPEHSDLDFLVTFDPSPTFRPAAQYFGLLHDLERLLGCPVDLVEESAITNRFFREQVEATRGLLYAA